MLHRIITCASLMGLLALINGIDGQEWKWNGSEWVLEEQRQRSNNNYFRQSGRECWQGGQWVPEGTEEDHGRFYYKCTNGRSVPAGCITPSRQRIGEFETFTSADRQYELTCQKDGSGNMEMKLTACIKRGQRIRPGQTFEDDTQYHICKQVNDWHIQMDSAGCIKNGRKIAFGQEVQEGDTWFTCERNGNNDAELHARGCVQNGQRLDVGDQYPDGEFVYYCKIENGRAETMCVGCKSPAGQELFDGDRYTKDDSVYQCDIRIDNQSHRLIGCVQRDSGAAFRYGNEKVERVIGCHWYEEDGNQAWEMKCVDEGSRALKEAVGCIYKENGVERLSVPPGTFTLWYSGKEKKNQGVGCRDNARGQKPTLFMFDPSQVRQVASDLVFKSPMGRKRR